MSLREEILDVIRLRHNKYNSDTYIRDKIIKTIEKRIDSMIGVDNQTINMKNGTMEGKIAAQASRNTLTLVKEMLRI